MVLDLSMPTLDGMGVLQELKAMTLPRKPRVVVLTAYGSIPVAVKAVRLGAMDFLEKPVTPEVLRQAVADVLAEELPETHPPDELDRGPEEILDRVRKALRMAEYADAESLLARAADLAARDPAYYNLMGIIYESRRRFRLARKFYNRALSIRDDYEPARSNLQRLAELQSRRWTTIPVMLGDPMEKDVWMARLPEGKQ
jgi:DNA-binding response OmpR family regulator